MKLQYGGGLALAGYAAAQAAAYAQCGGSGFSGQTTCVSGYTCVESNEWYSQCIPGTGMSSAKSGQTSSISPASSSSALPSALPSSVSPAVNSSSVLPVATAIVATTGAATTAAATSTKVATSTSTANAYADGTLFNIDGVTHYAAGTNTYWLSYLTDDDDVNTVMSHVASSGLKILRVWGFNDVTTIPSSGVYFQYLSSSGSTINTGTNGLQRLDAVVSAAETYGVKLIINFVNNWSDYGGIAAYNTAFGSTATDWYTDSASQAQYKKYIQAVVSRYSNSTAIFAWELANEPRCSGCDTSVIYNWATTTSAYVKSLDAAHMVALGDEGFGVAGGDGTYQYTTDAGGYNFSTNLQIPDLDFGTFHMYPAESWSESDGDWALEWIATHGAACVAAGKPCLLEEYGTASNHTAVEGPWQTKALDTDGIAADLIWQMADTLSTGESNTDSNSILYGSSEWTSLVTDHVAAINAS